MLIAEVVIVVIMCVEKLSLGHRATFISLIMVILIPMGEVVSFFRLGIVDSLSLTENHLIVIMLLLLIATLSLIDRQHLVPGRDFNDGRFAIRAGYVA